MPIDSSQELIQQAQETQLKAVREYLTRIRHFYKVMII